MRQDREPEDLIKVWMLLEDDMKRVRNKSGATRLGFALLLKFFEVEARCASILTPSPPNSRAAHAERSAGKLLAA